MAKFEEEIRTNVSELCRKHNLAKPLTVYGSARILMEHIGIGKTIELFQGARDETKHDVFRTSAFEAVLDTLLNPNQKNE